MIRRFAFASLAVIGLAGPAFAVDDQSTADAAASDEGNAGPNEAAAPRRARRIARPRIVAVLPPQRPDDAATGEIAAPSIPDVPAPVTLAVTERRSASALADAVEDAPATGRTTIVTVLPPLRPSIAPAASALADVEQTEQAAAAADDETSPARPPAKAVATLPPSRPAFRGDEAAVETAALTTEPAAATPATAVVPETGLFGALFGSPPQTPLPEPAIVTISSGRAGLDSLIATHARLNGVPADLVHRVVIRESKYNPRAVGHGGAMGLMQIKTATARGLGYGGNAAGLLDAETNITYAVKYLAGAYRTANGDYARAISYYARGYYYAQKRNGSIREASNRGRRRDRQEAGRQEADATPPGVTWNTAAIASESSSRVP